MTRRSALRIAVIGAGPIGLEAALHAAEAGYAVTVYERGDVADAVARWGHVRLFTPFGMNVTPLGLETIRREHPQHQLPGANDLVTGHEFRELYLLPLTLTSKLADQVKTGMEVVAIGRQDIVRGEAGSESRRGERPFRLLIRDNRGTEALAWADVIFDCSGTYGSHAWIGDGGIPAVGELAAKKHIAYGLDDVLGKQKARYAGKSVLVVGGGYSAATTVCALAQLAEEHPATWVIWVTRGPRSTPLPRNPADPLRERDRLAARANNLAARGDGNVEFHAPVLIDEVVCHGPDQGFRVAGRQNGKTLVWEVDRVIGNVGYVPDLGLTRELPGLDFAGGRVRQAEPNYFVLGMKSHGRDSNFLLREGHEQIREALHWLQQSPRERSR